MSGLAKFMAPESLVGKRAAFLTNLKPGKLRGIMSQAMILAASNAYAFGPFIYVTFQ